MSLFEEVGRKFERAKRSVTGGDDYRCADCGATFDTDHDHCPDCGAAAVEERDDETGESEAADAEQDEA